MGNGVLHHVEAHGPLCDSAVDDLSARRRQVVQPDKALVQLFVKDRLESQNACGFARQHTAVTEYALESLEIVVPQKTEDHGNA